MKFYPATKRPPTNLTPKSMVENDDPRELLEVVDEDIFNLDTELERLHIVAAQSGFVMSLLALLSTVGIDYILSVLVFHDGTELPKKLNVLILGATTCVLILVLAFLTLSLLHVLATHVYYKAPQRTTMTTTSNTRTDKGLQEVLHDVDVNYVLGAVTGISLLWTAMDFFMGLFYQSVFPATVLVVTFVCFRISHASSTRKNIVGKESTYYALQDTSPESHDCLFHVTVL